MTYVSDTLIRQEALDTRRSFAVSAPAGSGKTGLLTQRVLALLGECEQPENILAITFTKKAAAEMQHRILSALLNTQKQLNNNEKPPTNDYDLKTWELAKQVLLRDQEKEWQLLSLPNRLRITTIDSFCRLLSQQMPLNNGMGNIPEMLDSADADHAYLLAARETLALLESQHSIKDDLAYLLSHFNNQLATIEELFIKLLKRRDQWLAYLFEAKDQRQLLENTLLLVIQHHLSQLQKQTGSFAGDMIELVDYAAAYLSKENSTSIICNCLGIKALPSNDPAAVKQWQALAELLLTKDGKIRKKVTKTQGFPAVDKKQSKEEQAYSKQQKQRMEALLQEIAPHDELIEQLHLSRHLPNINYSDEQWQLLDSLTRVLSLLVAQLSVIFQQLGKSDFISVSLSAQNALGDENTPTDLALALDYRIQHILVDEFQDTSTPQLKLLKTLTSGWQMDDGRTLFVVGDAMQSCYGFRDANVGLFLDCRNNGIGDIALTPLDLSVNFRSQAPLVEWCNTVFTSVFPKDNRVNQGAVKYQLAEAYHSSTDSASSKTYTGANTHLLVSIEKLNNRDHEAKLIVELIHEHQKNQPQNTIAILVRKRSQVSSICHAMNQAGIAYRATDLDKLNTNMVAIDLLNLTRALLYPNDRIAWLALLRAPWCGLDMTDIYQVANYCIDNTPTTITSTILEHKDFIPLSEKGKVIFERFRANLVHIFHARGRNNLRDWIEAAWIQLGGDALLFNDEEKLAVDAFFSCLEKYQQGGKINHWNTFVNAVDQLYNKQKHDTAEKGLNKTVPLVDIMTIHKSKGLEFDSVIIPGIDLLPNSDKQELMVWLDWIDDKMTTPQTTVHYTTQSKLLISPVHATGNEKDSIYDYIRLQQKQKQLLESDRLLYVGCTRAITQLHLIGQTTIKAKADELIDKNTLTKPNNSSALNRVWDYIINDATIYPIEGEAAKNNQNNEKSNNSKETHPNKIARLSSGWIAPKKSDNGLLKKYRLENDKLIKSDNNIASPSELKHRYDRYFGQVMHAALELITNSGIKHWDKQKVSRQLPFWEKQLLQLGIEKSQLSYYAEKLFLAIQTILKSKKGQWLLDSQHPESQCELALWSKQSGGAKELIIDRTFIDQADNVRWIIDYKSSEPSPDQSIAEFTQQERLSYSQQLQSYGELFTDTAETIRFALYFPLIDLFYELDDISTQS
ncbi:MAG: UvrD-helicase domain-containing protein [Cellvibrionaceae bacterium]